LYKNCELNAGHDTAEIDPTKKSYRPLFLDHFDKKDAAAAANAYSTNFDDGNDPHKLVGETEISNASNQNLNPVFSNYTSRFYVHFIYFASGVQYNLFLLFSLTNINVNAIYFVQLVWCVLKDSKRFRDFCLSSPSFMCKNTPS
jgi:hypothetical protein